MAFSSLCAGAMARMRYGMACGLALAAAGAAAGAMPTPAQAHPELSTDLLSQDGLMAVAGAGRASALHRHLDIGLAEVTETAGPLRYGITMQYGTIMATDPNDYIGHEADHRSLRIDREIFAGATASLGLYQGWRLLTSGGRVQLRMHDSLGDMTRRGTLNEGTLMGWRMTAGLQHGLGDGVLTLGWQMTHYVGGRCSDPAQPTRASAGHVGLELVTPL